MTKEIRPALNQETGSTDGGRRMGTIIFPILAEQCSRPYDPIALRSEFNRILEEIRSKTGIIEVLIPEDVEDMVREQLDWTVDTIRLMTARETVDLPTLLRIDAIGAALDLEGCTLSLK